MLQSLMWIYVAIAVFCTAYLFFSAPNVVKRSRATCYPLPEIIEQRLLRGDSLEDLENIAGPRQTSFCVRCLVWRPPALDSTSHHCQICQRCVTGFDHHCGVFGRCI